MSDLKIKVSDRGVPKGTLLWLVVVVIWCTCAPFAGGPTNSSFQTRIPTEVPDILGNFILLIPFAATVTAGCRIDHKSRWLLRIAAVAALFSCFIEAGQLNISGRVSALSDVFLNSMGAAFGAWFTILAKEHGFSTEIILTSIVTLVLLTLLLYLNYSTKLVTDSFRIAGWDPEFKVVLGEEANAGRQYQGSVEEAQLCAPAATQAICLSADADETMRARLVEIAESSQQVKLYAKVISADDTQTGPTRIITFSKDAGLRNLTLAQEGRSLVFRIRTLMTGPNGTDPEFALPDVVSAHETLEALTSFDNGVIRISAQSEAQRSEVLFQFELFTAWLINMPVRTLEPKHFYRGAIATCTILFIGLGLILGRIIHALLLSSFLVVGISVLFAMLEWNWGYMSLNPHTLMLSAVLALVGVVLAAWDA